MMWKAAYLLAGFIAAALLGQLIADDQPSFTSGSVIVEPTNEQMASRYLELAKRKMDLLVRDGRTQEIRELTKKFEEELEQLEAAQKKAKDEKQAEEKLMAASASLHEVIKSHPNSRAAILAQQALGAMRSAIGANLRQNESPLAIPPSQPPQSVPTYRPASGLR